MKLNNLLNLTNEELINILNFTDSKQEELWNIAREVRKNTTGTNVYIRGLIEFSNICHKNCYYCGIRQDNLKVNRYRLTVEEVMSCVDFITQNQIPSIVLQSGEIATPEFKEYLINMISTIKNKYKKLSITLSSGEFDYSFYQKLNNLRVNRYLLRIETSNKELYSKLHPESHNYLARYNCLKNMQKIGYQVGTGNMIGTPFQTDLDIINDLKFFVKENFDMFGLGPYIIHQDTPLSNTANIDNYSLNKEKNLNKTLNFIAMLRILMPDSNIATATALDVLHQDGRVMALQAGANVIMPSFTPKINKRNYSLYENKPNVDDDWKNIIVQMENKIKKANMVPIYNQEGHSLHYLLRKQNA